MREAHDTLTPEQRERLKDLIEKNAAAIKAHGYYKSLQRTTPTRPSGNREICEHFLTRRPRNAR